MKKINKTLQQQKWYDFTHPTKIEHYGYHFSGNELRQFPEGRIILLNVAKIKLEKRQAEKIAQIVSGMFNTFNNTLDELVLDCLV